MEIKPNPLAWFEIPALDLDRAIHCYSHLLGTSFDKKTFGPMTMAVFAYAPGALGGALVSDPGHKPSADGPLVYFDCNPSLQTVLDRAATQGLKITLPSTELPNNLGFIAILHDTEGNRIGLHASAA
jgi:uncharacterized protein